MHTEQEVSCILQYVLMCKRAGPLFGRVGSYYSNSFSCRALNRSVLSYVSHRPLYNNQGRYEALASSFRKNGSHLDINSLIASATVNLRAVTNSRQSSFSLSVMRKPLPSDSTRCSVPTHFPVSQLVRI